MVLGLMGLGVVGSGVYELVQQHTTMRVKTILDRACRLPNMTTDAAQLLGDPQIDCVVEAMGGLHPTYEYALRALEQGKHFVTSNKHLVSVYGEQLNRLARDRGVAFLFGAACGGGIPYLDNLHQAAQTEAVQAVGGILNGTTNYILDAMQRRQLDYAQALKEAQAKGFAEADPSQDVDGLDTMRKLMLSCAVGFHVFLRAGDIAVQGIGGVTGEDIRYLARRGLALKLHAYASRGPGGLCAYVEPTAFAHNSPEGALAENLNCVWYEAAGCGRMRYLGQGAGKMPTAANVLRDVQAISTGRRYLLNVDCSSAQVHNAQARHSYYVRLPKDAPAPPVTAVSREEDARWAYLMVSPLDVQQAHQLFKNRPGTFFAGFAQGAQA